LKSFYDLTSSLVSAIRNSPTNWLIVEGNTDKKYINHYIDPDINLKILPVGGAPIVKKIYEYLYLPISINEETNSFKGSILCLIDTDPVSVKLDFFNEDPKNQRLKIRRLQIEKKDGLDQVSLLRLGVGTDTECEIEHVLNPQKLYNSIFAVATDETTEDFTEVIDIIGKYTFNEKCQFSKVMDINTIFKTNSIDCDLQPDLQKIKNYLDKRKDQVCDQYISMDNSEKLIWIEEIEKMFSKS
jgi:hypothetical protein